MGLALCAEPGQPRLPLASENAMKPMTYAVLACVGVVVTMPAGQLRAQDLRKTSLRLDFVATGYHAPFYLGVAKGLYREQGIDLQIQEGKGSASSATLV